MNAPRAAAALSLLLCPAFAGAQSEPRYLPQVRAELQAMGYTAQCAPVSAAVGTCRVEHVGAASGAGAAAGRRFELVVEYSDVTDTVYAYLTRYATLRVDQPNATTAFRRVAEMNWEMLVGKFEWSAPTGELRLGAVMQTDSNFDRRAFRGVVRSLLRLGDRYADEVSRLTGATVGEAPAVTAGTTMVPVAPPR
jgi:hypothetical protein